MKVWLLIAFLCSSSSEDSCVRIPNRQVKVFASQIECAIFAKLVIKFGGFSELAYTCDKGLII